MCTCAIILFPTKSLLFNSYDGSLGFRHRPTGRVDYMVSLPAHGAVIGAWFGAWPMPLDWERPWQVLFISFIMLLKLSTFCHLGLKNFLPHVTIPLFLVLESSNRLSPLLSKSYDAYLEP